MNFSILASRAQKLVADNAPLILTSIGVTGTVATAVLVGKASFKAAVIIGKEQNKVDSITAPEDRYLLDNRTIVGLVWKEYVPAVTTCVFTIAAIICANRAGSRQAAALASAYSISETALREYKEKVLEHIGPKKEAEVREAIAQDAVKKDPPSKEIVILGGNNVLCRDGWSGRYFQSNVEDIKAAMNWINHQLNTHGAVTLTEFYSRIGLDPTEESEAVGWDTANQLDIMFEPVLTEDSRPCMSFSFRVPPSHNYNPFL
jgi:hypothetical protein